MNNNKTILHPLKWLFHVWLFLRHLNNGNSDSDEFLFFEVCKRGLTQIYNFITMHVWFPEAQFKLA